MSLGHVLASFGLMGFGLAMLSAQYIRESALLPIALVAVGIQVAIVLHGTLRK